MARLEITGIIVAGTVEVQVVLSGYTVPLFGITVQREAERKLLVVQPIILGREILAYLDRVEVQTGDAGGGGGWYGGAGARYFNDSSDSSKERYCGGGGGSGYIGGVDNGTTRSGGNAGNGKAAITLIE